MKNARQLLTLDSNVFVSAFKKDEPHRQKAIGVLKKVPELFALVEPSIVYQETCGTIARKVGNEIADNARKELDRMITRRMLLDCDRSFCVSSYGLCSEYGIYAIDALYMNVAVRRGSILVSLDGEDFIDRVRGNHRGVKAYHLSELP